MHAQDAELVRRCLDGETEAFGILVDNYQKALFNGCLRMVGSAEDAQDIVQTVFLKAYQKLPEFNPRYRFFSWIYKMMVNESINLIRSRKPIASDEEPLVATSPSPEAALAEQRRDDEIQNALMAIREDYRAILVLKYFGDLSYNELSFVFDLPEKTVKSRLYSARQKMADILTKQGVRRVD